MNYRDEKWIEIGNDKKEVRSCWNLLLNKLLIFNFRFSKIQCVQLYYMFLAWKIIQNYNNAPLKLEYYFINCPIKEEIECWTILRIRVYSYIKNCSS